jgi:hypothetical protein
MSAKKVLMKKADIKKIEEINISPRIQIYYKIDIFINFMSILYA